MRFAFIVAEKATFPIRLQSGMNLHSSFPRDEFVL